jgi:hypothetical protein
VRRWLDGPSVIADDWELSLQASRLPTVAELAAPLERVGYQLRFARLDESGAQTGPAAPSDSLGDGGLAVTDARVRAPLAGLVVRLTPARDGHYGLGFIEVRDTQGVYAELCQYLIGTLGELVPGVRFKRMGSALEPDDASTLRAQLAERPAFVDAR